MKLVKVMAIVGCLSVMSVRADQSSEDAFFHNKQKNVGSAYQTSVVEGLKLGALSGSVCALANTFLPFQLFIFFPIWLAERRYRAEAVQDISHEMTQQGVSNKKDLIADVAWISSWASWATVAGLLWGTR
jgi:hypothetical protein